MKLRMASRLDGVPEVYDGGVCLLCAGLVAAYEYASGILLENLFVVGYHYDGCPSFLVDGCEQIHYAVGGLVVQIARRLVCDDDVWLV